MLRIPFSSSARETGQILFITSNSLGDAVLSTGILAWLYETYPKFPITVVAGPVPAPLFDSAPGVAAVIPLPKLRHSRHWLDLWLHLRKKRWSMIVDLRNTLVSRLLPARERMIFRGSDKNEGKSLQLANAFGIFPSPPPRLWVSERAQNAAKDLMPGSGKILALAPAANWPGKQWPAERFAELALQLTGTGGILPNAAIAIFAAQNERERLKPLFERLRRADFPEDRLLDLAGRIDTLLAAACLQRADLFIGNDSGLMHMAAALGVPTLGLFGPSNDAVYGPTGTGAALIRTEESFESLLKDRSGRCLMTSLKTEDVKTAAERLFARRNFPAS